MTQPLRRERAKHTAADARVTTGLALVQALRLQNLDRATPDHCALDVYQPACVLYANLSDSWLAHQSTGAAWQRQRHQYCLYALLDAHFLGFLAAAALPQGLLCCDSCCLQVAQGAARLVQQHSAQLWGRLGQGQQADVQPEAGSLVGVPQEVQQLLLVALQQQLMGAALLRGVCRRL